MRAVIVVIAWLCSAHRSVAADPATDLEIRGEQLAKEGHFAAAIDAFKAADKIHATATHKCLIALAYTRRELWPQAEIFVAQCRQGRDEQVPEWVPEAEKLIATSIAAADVAPVEIVVDALVIGARLSVSSFAPDETFPPGTSIHLPPGHHVIVATAPGFYRAEQAIDVTDKTRRRVVIAMRPTPPPPAPAEVRRARALMIGGGVVIATGVLAYAATSAAWLELSNNGYAFQTSTETLYNVGRVATIGLWATGAALAIVGYVQHRRNRARPTAAATPVRGGMVVALQWQR